MLIDWWWESDIATTASYGYYVYLGLVKFWPVMTDCRCHDHSKLCVSSFTLAAATFHFPPLPIILTPMYNP